MKNAYNTPEMEVITFENEDIITTSGVIDGEENGLPIVPVIDVTE